jgi:membrane associated rhomboid family serine protease
VSQRFLVYPVLFITAMQLLPLLQRDRQWYAAQIAQHLLILLAALGAMVFEDDIRWVILAWLLFTAFIIAPRLLVRLRWWRWAGWLTWGPLGQLFRRYADAQKLSRDEALALLDQTITAPMPAAVRGGAQVFRLKLLTDAGDWLGAIEYCRSVENWGTLVSVTRARLLAARAYAHTGDLEQAMRSLQLVALSPWTLGELERQYLATRAEVIKLAGEVPESLRAAEEQSATWRGLLSWTRPAPVTLALVSVCAVIWLADMFLEHPLWLWAGNVPDLVRQGQWWRPATALFLHANFLHLAMNGASLWMFGTAVERTLGRWRMVAIFLVSGAAANFLSAWFARYDVSVGASGGIFGVVAGFAVALYRLRTPIYAAARRRLLMVLGLMLMVDLTIGGLEPQVDNLAHGAGFVVGLLLALVLRPGGDSGIRLGY